MVITVVGSIAAVVAVACAPWHPRESTALLVATEMLLSRPRHGNAVRAATGFQT